MKKIKLERWHYILIFLGVSITVTFFLMPGMAMSIFSVLTGGVTSCEEATYDPKCTCPLDSRKIYVPWIGVPRWSCENIEQLLIDPESPTFEQDAIAFVQSYLALYCGMVYTDVCSGMVCGCPEDNPNCGAFTSTHPIYPNDACISPVFGYGSQGARIVNVECVKINTWLTPQGELTHEESLAIYGNEPNSDIMPKSGTAPWRMEFFVESETDIPTTLEVFVHINYCYNEVLNKRCTHQSICDYYNNPEWCVGDLPLNIVPNDYPMMIIPMQIGSGWRAPL